MKSAILISATAVLVVLSMAPITSIAQSESMPDLGGLWMGAGDAVLSPNFVRQLGGELPFTDYGLERYENFDHALDTGGLCLPLGPTRTMQVNLPLRIVQTPDLLVIAYEIRHTFRVIYIDGRDHPDIVFGYPEWMGHSVGRYEGDALLVETVGINPRANLDNLGHEHSDQLRLEERFRRSGENTLEWDVTFHDPVFFTEPFTISKTFEIQENDRLMDYTCTENQKDAEHLVPGVVIGPQ